MILPLIPVPAKAAALENYDTGSDYSGVNFSFIGDSISTYYGITNSSTYNPLYLTTSEATFGTYYGNTSHGDYAEFSSVKWEDTWWKQAVDTLGGNLLVNNAWSGSFVLSDQGQSNTTEYGAAAYKDRCVNLHYGSKMPDIIGVFLGTNDIAYYGSMDVGTYADVDTVSERTALFSGVNKFSTPSSSIEAYYIMISRMVAKYPDAEIYCLLPTICQNTMGSGRINALNDFNAGVKYIVDYYASQGKKVYLVDLTTNSGLVDNVTVRNYYYCNNVHPSVAGMDWITSCFVSEILEHSTKGKGTYETTPVTYSLSDVFVKEGRVRQAVIGKSLCVTMLPHDSIMDVEITVTMLDADGNTVAIPGGGVQGDQVYIPEVTGPVTISAKTTQETDSFAWDAKSDAYTSLYGNGYTYNDTTLISGTYSYVSATNGATMTTTNYSLAKPVVLQYDQPWVLEWRSGGSTYAGGIMLFNKEADSGTDGNMYIHITQSNVFFGYRTNSLYHNSGVAWTTIASKLGSSDGANIRNQIMDFKVVNEPNGTSNQLRLYVNGVDMGTMDQSKMIGSSATHENVGDINISGKDFVFNYLGSASHTWNNCNVGYIRVHESGVLEPVTDFESYRWEVSDSGDAFESVVDDTYSFNGLTRLSGSISSGAFTGTSFTMDKSVVLMHDNAWKIEWVSEGDWQDNRGGGMLLGTDLNYKGLYAPYIYRRPGSDFIAIGEWRDSQHNNYGITLSDYGIDGTARHKYALVNEVGESSNMVYLYVDDVKLGAMDNYHVSANADSVKSDWISGKDFVFSTVGTTEFTVGGCEIEYLEIVTGCVHSFGSWSTTTAPTCTTAGVQTRICSLCGETETRSTAVAGHSYDSAAYPGSCTQIPYIVYTCSVCGDTYRSYPDEYMSDWQTEYPDVDASRIESRREYRYRDYETKTSTSGSLSDYTLVGHRWIAQSTDTVYYVNSWPGGFLTTHSLYAQYNNLANKKEASESTTTKVEIDSDEIAGYLYYHWCYAGDYVSMESKTGSYVNFHAYFDTVDPSQFKYDPADGSYGTYHTSTCTNSNWYWPVTVYAQTSTTYQCEYSYERWTDWSAWSAAAVEATDTREVETRMVYRYVTTQTSHNYQSSVTAPTCTKPGSTQYTCTQCGDTYSETIPASGHNYESVVTPPTCEKAGYTTYTCSVCDDAYIDDPISATGHNYVGGVCTNCGDTLNITVYFDTAVKGWENVNAYAWNDAGSNAAWPGAAMTHVEGTVYSIAIPADMTNIIFNNGSYQTGDLTVPGVGYAHDGYNWVLYGEEFPSKFYVAGSGALGDWNEAYAGGLMENQGGGKFAVTFELPADSYEYKITNGTWNVSWGYGEGNYSFKTVRTSFVTVTFDVNTNAASVDIECQHGDETATVTKAPTCTEPGVMTYTCDCGDFYTEEIPATGHEYKETLTSPTCEAGGYTTFKCVNCGYSYTRDHVAALGHSYANGTCTVCGAADPNYVAPAIKASTVSLSFEDEILLNVYFTTQGLGDVKDYGLLIYSEKVTAPTHENAIAVNPGYYESNGYLGVTTPGIPAKKMGDKVYFAVYAELADGSYFYSKCYNYAPSTYAYSLLSKSDTTQDMKNLVVAMLNYGAAAQTYFDYNTENMVNASLTEEQKAFVADYNGEMLDGLATCTADKKGELFGNGNTGFGKRTPSVNFEGAFSVNFYFSQPKATVGSDVTFYVWDAETYNAVETLLPENAIATSKCTFDGTYYAGIVEGIAAKEVDKTFYCAAIYTGTDGNTYVSGVISYSLGYYLENQANGTAMPDFAKATGVYAYYAKQNFFVEA